MSYHEGSNWQAKKEDEGKSLYENPLQEIETLKDELANRETIIAGHEETIRQLEQKHYGYYQLCPKCNGQKKVLYPPHLPAGLESFSSSQTEWPCDICKGGGLLVRPEINSYPPTQEATGFNTDRFEY